ncbi:MAG: FHA domain-containing protein [Eubacterium sp.]|nr:FHA domain-containing protein [Eubacterium sp.]
MNPLQIQTNAQGSFVTYKLEHQESLDRMTMGMLTNNKIKGMIPIDYSQIDSERWIKYDITSMQPLQSYLSGILTRKKALGIFSQIVNTFLLAEDYMIDASFIILDINNIYINAGTEELGIICLPVSGFVSNVTLQDLAANITRRGQFNSRENCDYVTKILNFVNGSQFSIAGFKDLLDELTRDSVQRIQRENMDHDMTGEAESALEEVNGQMAVAVESVADMVGQNTGNQRQQGIWIGDGKGGSSSAGGAAPPVSKEKQKKEKKGLFGKKKKKAKKEQKVKPPSGGVDNNGMMIPGMDSLQEQKLLEPSKPTEKPSAGAVSPPPGRPVMKPAVPPDLSGIASQINMGQPRITNSVDKPEWSISQDLGSGVGVSDNTIMLKLEEEPTAVLCRVRTGEEKVVDKGELVMGKASSGVDYCIRDNTTISRVHAKILRHGTQYFIQDNDSMNHTYVDGRQVMKGEELPIQNGSRIRLSDEEFIFKL